MKRKNWYWMILLVALTLLLRGLWENTALEANTYTVESSRLPGSFDGLRIAQVSDLHNGCLGPDNTRILSLLAQSEPDLIVLTGDLIDSRHADVGNALAFARSAVAIAPVWYVPGNHEARGSYEELRQGLVETGVHVLQDSAALLNREGESIQMIGLLDPAFSGADPVSSAKALAGDRSLYSIILSHRPERFKELSAYGDLIFAGHAHGGQIRLPILGGLLAPGQGLLPQYDGGIYTCGDSTMVLSRGVGNSLLPLRLGNRPEIVVTILKTIREK